jgi:hypothetical protein
MLHGAALLARRTPTRHLPRTRTLTASPNRRAASDIYQLRFYFTYTSILALLWVSEKLVGSNMLAGVVLIWNVAVFLCQYGCW